MRGEVGGIAVRSVKPQRQKPVQIVSVQSE